MNLNSPVLRTSMLGLLGAVVMIGCGDDGPPLPTMDGRRLCVFSFDAVDSFELRDIDTDEVFNTPPDVDISGEKEDTSFQLVYIDSGNSSRIERCTTDELDDEPIDESEEAETSTTTEVTTAETMPVESTTSVGRATTTQVRTSEGTTTVARATTTMAPYGTTTTSYVPTGPPTGTWIRNDSRCSWRGASSCGVYSGGDGQWEEVGPSGGPGSTFTPIAGTSGQIAYNLYSGNSIQGCDWNGTGECGWYFTGTPGTYNMGPVG